MSDWHFSKQPHYIVWLYALPLLAATIMFCMMVWVIAMRWHYPYQLEWIEGSVLQHVVRLTESKPIYQLPDMTFAPALYTPLYYYVSAAVAEVMGNNLPTLRLVSIVATLGSGFCISGIAWKLTQSRLAAVLAFLMVATPFRFTGFWFDVARVDSLWSFFLLATVLSLVHIKTNQQMQRWILVASALCVCAVYTKQTTLFLMPFFAVAVLLWNGFRCAALFTIWSAALLILLCLVFQWQSDNLFYFFTMQMAANHNMTSGFPLHFFKGDLLESVPVILIFVFYGLLKQCRIVPRIGWGWVIILLGFMGMTLLARLYAGGAKNVTMPMHFLLVALAVTGFSMLLKSNGKLPNKKAAIFTALCSLLFTLNIVFSVYIPQWLIPSVQDKAYGDALVKRIAAVPGRVCLSRDGYLAYLAGKDFCAHETQLTDILNGGVSTVSNPLIDDAKKRIMGGYYDVLIVDSITDIGNYVNVLHIPYIGTPLDLGGEVSLLFNPVNGGPRPHLWLELQPDRVQLDFK